MIKKTLIAIIAIFTILLNITTADARALDYYSPMHIYEFVEKNGYEFVELGYEDRHTFFEKDYQISGKKIKATSLEGELRGLAHAYDNITGLSKTNAFKQVVKKDIYSLEHMYDNFYDYTTNKEVFVDTFLVYCIDESRLKTYCPNIYEFLIVNVMAIFDDVSPSSWYWSYVNEAHSLGLMTGATETLFKPNSKMNRAMVAVVLYRMEGSPKTKYAKYFEDVDKNQYYSTAVTWAKKNGVINGYTDGTFKPTRNVTREEMAIMLYNYGMYKGAKKKVAPLKGYKDFDKINIWACPAMSWCVANGIIAGKDNGTRLDPKGTATRAECAKMLVQAYKLIY